MKIIKCRNYEEVSLEAAKLVIDLLKRKPNCTLGLATGSSPIGLYQNLIKAYQNKEISFKEVLTYNLDEYCDLDRNHPESYYSFMHRNLFNHIDIDEKNIHLPYAEASRQQECCDEYSKMLHQAKIDLQVLGIGGNGHVGFNEPGTPFNQETFIVTLTEKTRDDNKRFFNSIDEVPTQAITMGIKNIMEAKQIILLATGKGKADAIKALVEGPYDVKCPASCLQRHDDVVVIVDEDAASLLKEEK